MICVHWATVRATTAVHIKYYLLLRANRYLHAPTYHVQLNMHLQIYQAQPPMD